MLSNRPNALVLIAMLIVVTSASAQLTWVDVTVARGIVPTAGTPGSGVGVAAADCDGDGDIDLFVPTAFGVPNQLYTNNGSGSFVEVAAAVGLDATTPDRAALWVDIDGDADLDLFVARDSCLPGCTADLLRLYRQESNGHFTEITAPAGLTGIVPYEDGMEVGGLAAGDFNGDEHVDVIVGYWAGETLLLTNDGVGNFTNTAAGTAFGALSEHWQPVVHDFDGDGWEDVYYAIDFTANRLWLNQQDGTFVDVASVAGADNAMNDMGVALGDYDNDGDFDIYVTNATQNGDHNILLRNDSVATALQFTEISQSVGVWQGGWGWGTSFVDADCDGWLDIIATNGAGVLPWSADTSYFYRNLGGPTPTFADLSVATGFADTFWGSALLSFDADRDGDPDVIQSCVVGPLVRILDNQPTSTTAPHNWLVVRPRSAGPNTHAIGATVRVTAGGMTQSRKIGAGTSFLGQEPAEAFFGLAAATTIDIVRIEYPNGWVVEIPGVAPNQTLTVLDSDTLLRGDCNGDAAQDISDAITLLSLVFGVGVTPPACDDACDANDDGALNVADAVGLLNALFAVGPGTIPLIKTCTLDISVDALTCSTAVCP